MDVNLFQIIFNIQWLPWLLDDVITKSEN